MSYLACFVLFLQAFRGEACKQNAESALHQKLLEPGSKLSLPSVGSNPVKVQIGLSMTQLVDLEEATENLVINAWIRQVWHNPVMTWNVSEYEDIKQINVAPYQVWTPDLYLYSNVEADKSYNGFLDTISTLINIDYKGRHTWNAPIILRTMCFLKIKDYPFDTQACEIRIGSFTYDHRHVDLIIEADRADTTKYAENVEWNLLSMNGRQELVKYNRWPVPFSDVVYELRIKRKPLFLLANLLFPNTVLSFLTVIVYCVPVTAGERASFVVSLLLAMSLFLTSAFNLMPDSSDSIPFFSYFLCMTLLTMFLLTVCLCYTLSLHFSNARVSEVPTWLRYYVLDKLATFLFLNVSVTMPKWRRMLRRIEPINTEIALRYNHPGTLWPKNNNQNLFDRNLNLHLNPTLLHQVSQKLSAILRYLKDVDDVRIRQNDWRMVAKVLDTFAFYFFSMMFTIIFGTCVHRLLLN